MSGYNNFAFAYDIFTKNVDYKNMAEFIADKCRKYEKNINNILETACGTGSLGFELEKQGFNVVCSDISPEMLMVATNKKYELESQCMFICQDMQDIQVGVKKDCVVCALDSLNHLENFEGVEKTFKSVYNSLCENGLFIFDVNTIYKHKNILGNNAFNFDYDEGFCAWQNELLDNNQVKIFLDIFLPDNNNLYERISEDFIETAYACEQIEKALEKNGFELLAKYDDYTENPPCETTQRVVYVARATRKED